MDYFGGLDVSVKDTSVCIVDGTGKIVREVKVASEPQALLAVLRNATYCFKRIGLEAGPSWHGADDASGTLSTGPCENVAQSEAADAFDPSQACAIEGHCSRQ